MPVLRGQGDSAVTTPMQDPTQVWIRTGSTATATLVAVVGFVLLVGGRELLGWLARH